ncbi:hypothetical protein CLAFUW4_06863 [Fulvia fulva]|uniref:Uncharacterized protein n=1 Tax=Passalora fulva TaxID=5499 RepID=A0A9Q8UR60_PASFU|nr:uncharacterized protein CLAFUR5_07001 [Fulvia fulva]KAK4621376.1 hypothetical protein CLAFUR4_06871 [Fulvia fulva]KAK4622895.1 hypothetical protein CLAFUR0_06868 [Fulvia fulva]UJO19418.1 hypothetical protein CLAFUR5_07001 [Fulvia fulva]WPV15676.1 hypothetical protein CLAFUW4_06863 [Fulvia fulva]WPV31453.1 hypothetical protein CLAFUW7_06862 [Fulvia fulva]
MQNQPVDNSATGTKVDPNAMEQGKESAPLAHAPATTGTQVNNSLLLNPLDRLEFGGACKLRPESQSLDSDSSSNSDADMDGDVDTIDETSIPGERFDDAYVDARKGRENFYRVENRKWVRGLPPKRRCYEVVGPLAAAWQAAFDRETEESERRRSGG